MLTLGNLSRIALRNLGRNTPRSALAVAAIAIGVAALILSGGFVHDLILQLGEALIHSQSGHVQIAKSGYFDVGSRSPGRYLLSPDDVDRIAIADLEPVRQTMRRIGFSGLLSNGRSGYPIAAEGIEPEREAELGTYMVLAQGRALSAQDRYAALVGAGVARALGLRAGSVVQLVAPTVDDAINTLDVEIAGIFQSFSRDYDDRMVKLPLSTAQELLDTRGVNVLVIELARTADTPLVATDLVRKVGDSGLEVRTWDQLNDFYWKAAALYDRQFGVLQLIVLVMVSLAVLGAVNMSVLERAGEFGTMRALGNRAWDVFRLVMIEGAALAVLGAALGALLGAVAALAISYIGIPMPPPPNSNLEFTARVPVVPTVVAGAAFLGIAATLLASLGPAIRVTRLPIAEALRRLA